MINTLRLALCLLCFGLISISASAAELPAAEFKDPVAISLINEEESIQPGHPFWIGIRLQIDDQWHAYWKNPGDAGMAPVVTWNLPEGFKADALLWPTPTRFALDSAVGFGYENEMILLAQITPPASYQNSPVSIGADIRWVVCSNETCLPGETQTTLSLPVKQQLPIGAESHAELFKKARQQLPQAHSGLAAQRKDGLIELTFENALDKEISKADFFPEVQNIDYKEEALLQSDAQSYKVVLKEIETSSSLKGILVVHSANGRTAYHVDVPIKPSADDIEIISMSKPVLNSDQQVLQTISPKSPASSFEFEGGLSLAILLAFIGGFLLNLMPCVLPVISFKILSFIKMAGESRKLIFKHGLAFSFGVLLSFWVLAALLLSLQAYGRSVGWGFQLQEPLFVAVLAAFIFLFALSLFGLFEIGTSVIGAAAQAQQKSSKRGALFGSFLGGILATALATPCTGPFLGSAVGYAVTLPAPEAMLIFTSLGLGMSWPYLAFAAFPSLMRFLPKPGPWMITFKELMGFLMMASVLWLTWVFSAQAGTFALTLFLAGLFFLSLGGWVYGRWASPLRKKITRYAAIAVSLAIFCMGSYTIVLSASSWAESMGGTPVSTQHAGENIAEAWETFSPQRVAELRAKGTPVFIDFTAKWCLICQANHVILSTNEVTEKFSDLGVVKMKADWTKNDAVIAAELRKFGRNSVPLYVLYGSEEKAEPQILPQVLTSDTILEALEQLADSL